jgi:hypothetical protein
MDNFNIFVIIGIFVIICLAILCIVCFKNKLEHLTMESDEAIQNLASLYNVDQLTIGKLNATGIVQAEQLVDASLGPNMTVKAYIDAKIAALNAQITATNATVASNWSYVTGSFTDWVKSQDSNVLNACVKLSQPVMKYGANNNNAEEYVYFKLS